MLELKGVAVTPKIKDFLMPNWQKNYSATKREFIETLLPLIAYENQKISFDIDRERVFCLKEI